MVVKEREKRNARPVICQPLRLLDHNAIGKQNDSNSLLFEVDSLKLWHPDCTKKFGELKKPIVFWPIRDCDNPAHARLVYGRGEGV